MKTVKKVIAYVAAHGAEMNSTLTHRCQVTIRQSVNILDNQAGLYETFYALQAYCHEVECPWYLRMTREQALPYDWVEIAHEAAAQHTHRMNRAREALAWRSSERT